MNQIRQKQEVSVKKAFTESVKILSSITNIFIIISGIVVACIFFYLSYFISTLIPQPDGSITLNFISVILRNIGLLSFVNILLKMVSEQSKNKISIIDFIYLKPLNILNYFVAEFIILIITVLGFVFFVIGSILVLSRLGLFVYLIIDENSSIFDSIGKSWILSQNQWPKIALMIILTIMINLVGFASLLIGLIFTIPITTLACAQLYKQLKTNYEQEQQSQEFKTSLATGK